MRVPHLRRVFVVAPKVGYHEPWIYSVTGCVGRASASWRSDSNSALDR